MAWKKIPLCDPQEHTVNQNSSVEYRKPISFGVAQHARSFQCLTKPALHKGSLVEGESLTSHSLLMPSPFPADANSLLFYPFPYFPYVSGKQLNPNISESPGCLPEAAGRETGRQAPMPAHSCFFSPILQVSLDGSRLILTYQMLWHQQKGTALPLRSTKLSAGTRGPSTPLPFPTSATIHATRK